MRRIGWIGLGKMGAPMAWNLASAGHALTVFNRSASKAQALSDAGAKVASTAAETALGAEVVFSMLADDTALRQMLLGADGVVAAMSNGAVLVEMSTVSPEVSAEVAQATAEHGIAYIRAPVSGSVAFAAPAKLTILASGPSAAYEDVLPLLKHLGAQQFLVGDACEARGLKLVINMMVGVTAAMTGEAMALGRKLGMDRETMLDVIGASAVASPLIGYKLAVLKAQDYTPTFEAAMMAKDFDLILDAAISFGTPMPLAVQVKEGLSALVEQGDGGEDFFKYVELCASRAGLDGS